MSNAMDELGPMPYRPEDGDTVMVSLRGWPELGVVEHIEGYYCYIKLAADGSVIEAYPSEMVKIG